MKADATEHGAGLKKKTSSRIEKLVEDSRKSLTKLILDSSSKVINSLLDVRELDERLGKSNVTQKHCDVSPSSGRA